MAYKKVQFVAYQTQSFFTTDPGAVGAGNAVPAPAPHVDRQGKSRPACAEPWLVDDALVRARRLREVVRFAQQKIATAKAGLTGGDAYDDDETLKVFVAPEFYFRQGREGYPHAGLTNDPTAENPCSVDTLMQALREIFQTDEFKHWLIVPGTIFSHWGETAKKTIAFQLYLSSNNARIDTTATPPLKPGRALASAGKVADLEDLDFTKVFMWDIQVDPGVVPPNYWQAEQGLGSNYVNSTVIIQGGVGGRYITEFKGDMSTIDVTAINVGDPNPQGRDVYNTPLYESLLNDWERVKERVFVVDDVWFGVEVCLDHLRGVLKDVVDHWDTKEAAALQARQSALQSELTNLQTPTWYPSGTDLEAKYPTLPGLAERKEQFDRDRPDIIRRLNGALARLKGKGALEAELANLKNGSYYPTEEELAARYPLPFYDINKQSYDLERPYAIQQIERMLRLVRKPEIDVHLISSCGMYVNDGRVNPTNNSKTMPNHVRARDGGYVMLCDGSTSTSFPRYDFRAVGASNAAGASAPSAVLVDEKVPGGLEIPRPPVPSGWAMPEQRVVAYRPVPLPGR